jgi:NAD(P)H-nitrite reductase large subunit
MTRYVILGTGVAAIAAADEIRIHDSTGDLTLVGDDPFGYYSRPGLAYYLTGELDENLLYPYRKEDYQKLNMRYQRARATRIFPAEKQVELDKGARLPYDKLLIATGAGAMPLKIPGADLKGVHKLDHMTDARALLADAKRGRTALVTGGGITALELAEGLAARGVKVHYILRSARYWSGVLDELESGVIESLLAQEGITLHHKSEIVEILGKNGKVQAARLADGRTLKADLLAYAIGIAPRLELARQSGLDCERGILVNEYMQTSQSDIYAAGDAAQVFDPASGKHLLDSLWNPAREQGRAVARNMTGHAEAYRKPPVFNVTRLAGLTVTIIGAVGVSPLPQGDGSGVRSDPDLLGIARGDSETWRQVPDVIVAQGGFEVNRLRLMVGEKHLLGALVMGDQKLSGPLQAIVAQKIDISPIRAQLLAPNAPIADILAAFVSDR